MVSPPLSPSPSLSLCPPTDQFSIQNNPTKTARSTEQRRQRRSLPSARPHLPALLYLSLSCTVLCTRLYHSWYTRSTAEASKIPDCHLLLPPVLSSASLPKPVALVCILPSCWITDPPLHRYLGVGEGILCTRHKLRLRFCGRGLRSYAAATTLTSSSSDPSCQGSRWDASPHPSR